MYKVLDQDGKLLCEATSFREAFDKGMETGNDFMIKKGTKRAESILGSLRKWYKWWTSPDRRVIEEEKGFRLV